jgi:transposase-like protein
MNGKDTKSASVKEVVWENLVVFVRGKVQELVQFILEDEVTGLLGRAKSERRRAVDSTPSYRNGFGKPRKLTLGCGTIEIRRPRVRGLEARFESRILPAFVRRSREVDEVLPELYLHGLACGDFDLAIRGLLGDEAPVSASTVMRLKEKWAAEWNEWAAQDLSGVEPVYMWVDGVYVKAGLEKEKIALLVVLVALSDGRKVFVAIKPGHRESTESWSEVLRDLAARGLRCPKLVIGDGHLGIWGALTNVYPQAKEQRCWNHRIVNVLDKLPRKSQTEGKELLTKIAYAETKEEAERGRQTFRRWCRAGGHEAAAACLDKDWERMVSFYAFPKEHWKHLRTTNPLESPFAALRIRTDAA